MSQHKVEQLEGSVLEGYWPRIEKMLDAVPHTWEDYHTKESILTRLLSGSIQAWGIGPSESINLVIFTQIARFSTGGVLEVFWAGGHGTLEKNLEILDPVMDRFAVLQNCKQIDVVGRDGWWPHLRNAGFKRCAVQYSRPVRDMRLQ